MGTLKQLIPYSEYIKIPVHCHQKQLVNGGDCVEKHKYGAKKLLNSTELFYCLYILF